MSEPVNVQVLGTIDEPSRRHLQGLTRQEIYRFLQEHFNDADARELCFLMDEEYEDLAGEERRDKMMSLVAKMERTGQLGELVEAMEQARPNLFNPAHRYRPRVYG